MAKGIIKSYLVLVVVLIMCLVLVSGQSINRQALLSQKISNNIQSNEVIDSNITDENNQGKDTSQGDRDHDKVINENNLTTRSIGIINNLYIRNNKIYITVDSLEFFRGEEAYNAARKDGKLYTDENGKEFLPDGYYIRNNTDELKTYEVSENSSFKLCIYLIDPKTTQNSSETVGVEYEGFEKYINTTKNLDGRSRMFWISVDKDIVTNLEMQFTP